VIDVEGRAHPSGVHPLRKSCLPDGLDDISLTSEFRDIAEQFETAYRRELTWLYSKDVV
jgi:3-isopropylmalate dehydratase small subunit